ncbi:hypothetical protein [Microvirga flavescens]|uniref:hypothetical protein n=1 Tax=Microvirga flavescens TaxID=2249811 RepID=UPI0013009C3B|nr:hypothetical protein [Microvirga flavescens]
MPDSIEDVAFSVGGAIISPSLGSGELILGLLVACGFAFSALHAIFHRYGDQSHSRRRNHF